ncbi:hypothetical protein, partial [Butyricimonas paravirosa]|uniref:hypothetical protein n=1 Tax=Butyricimonas paravirosa TaxID=1472417 RepID=UPI00210CCAB9
NNAQEKPAMAEMMANMYDASFDQLGKNELYFNPVYNYRSITQDWNYMPNRQTRNLYRYFSPQSKEVPRFEYDR